MYFTFRSVICCELMSVEAVRFVSRFTGFVSRYPAVPVSFVGMTVFALSHYLCSLVKDKLNMFTWIQFWAFYSAPLSIVYNFIYIVYQDSVSHYLDFSSMKPIFSWGYLFLFLLLCYMTFFYVWMLIFNRIHDLEIYSPICRLTFHFVDFFSFVVQKLNWCKFHLFISAFVSLLLGSYKKDF